MIIIAELRRLNMGQASSGIRYPIGVTDVVKYTNGDKVVYIVYINQKVRDGGRTFDMQPIITQLNKPWVTVHMVKNVDLAYDIIKTHWYDSLDQIVPARPGYYLAFVYSDLAAEAGSLLIDYTKEVIPRIKQPSILAVSHEGVREIIMFSFLGKNIAIFGEDHVKNFASPRYYQNIIKNASNDAKIAEDAQPLILVEHLITNMAAMPNTLTIDDVMRHNQLENGIVIANDPRVLEPAKARLFLMLEYMTGASSPALAQRVLDVSHAIYTQVTKFAHPSIVNFEEFMIKIIPSMDQIRANLATVPGLCGKLNAFYVRYLTEYERGEMSPAQYYTGLSGWLLDIAAIGSICASKEQTIILVVGQAHLYFIVSALFKPDAPIKHNSDTKTDTGAAPLILHKYGTTHDMAEALQKIAESAKIDASKFVSIGGASEPPGNNGSLLTKLVPIRTGWFTGIGWYVVTALLLIAVFGVINAVPTAHGREFVALGMVWLATILAVGYLMWRF